MRVKYGLDVDDFWQIKQNKQWVCRHAALEVVAVKAGIEWFPPQIIEANAPQLVTSMIVTGKMGDRVEWATGETNQTNYSVSGKQPAYPWAMSEKRAKDRVVLKLVGIHGLVYSEDEMPSVAPEPVRNEQAHESQEARESYSYLQKDLRSIGNVDDLRRWWDDGDVKELRRKIPEDWQRELRQEWEKTGKAMSRANAKPIGDVVDDIQKQFPGSKVVGDKFVDNFLNGEPLDGE